MTNIGGVLALEPAIAIVPASQQFEDDLAERLTVIEPVQIKIGMTTTDESHAAALDVANS